MAQPTPLPVSPLRVSAPAHEDSTAKSANDLLASALATPPSILEDIAERRAPDLREIPPPPTAVPLETPPSSAAIPTEFIPRPPVETPLTASAPASPMASPSMAPVSEPLTSPSLSPSAPPHEIPDSLSEPSSPLQALPFVPSTPSVSPLASSDTPSSTSIPAVSPTAPVSSALPTVPQNEIPLAPASPLPVSTPPAESFQLPSAPASSPSLGTYEPPREIPLPTSSTPTLPASASQPAPATLPTTQLPPSQENLTPPAASSLSPSTPLRATASSASERHDPSLHATPLAVTSPEANPLPPASVPSLDATAASARTANLAETANQIASTVAARILVTPALAHGGNGEIHISLQPTVLDGSTITLTAQNGTLSVAITPATPAAAELAAAALPHLADALVAHAPSFRHVQVSLAPKKGASNEAD